MAANPVLAAAQQLEADGYIELFELDTSPLFTVNGVATQQGEVYRWTSGIIDLRSSGLLAPTGTRTASAVTLDKLLPLVEGRPYRIVVDVGDGEVYPPTLVSSFTTVTIANPYGSGNISATEVTLAAPLTSVPASGAAWTFIGTNAVRFRGNDYIPMPIDVQGFEWSGTGKIPRPKLRVSNIGGLAGALVIANNDLLGAQVTRIRTFRNFLDDGETPDPTAFYEPDIYFVDRKSAQTRASVELELTAALDQQGLKLPRRTMIRDTCGYLYRQWVTDVNGITGFVPGTCPYSGGAYFKADDTSTGTASLDVCGLRQSSCVARFGAGARLPFNAFPGLSISR